LTPEEDDCGYTGKARRQVVSDESVWLSKREYSRRRRHTPGAKAPLSCWVERPKAKALGYLEAKATTKTFQHPSETTLAGVGFMAAMQI